jgi:hypothetical protein
MTPCGHSSERICASGDKRAGAPSSGDLSFGPEALFGSEGFELTPTPGERSGKDGSTTAGKLEQERRTVRIEAFFLRLCVAVTAPTRTRGAARDRCRLDVAKRCVGVEDKAFH